MASNIKEKNTIYAFEQRSSMPYPDDKNINYSSLNSYINSTSLNNTYQQLVDNDQYIANRLLSMKGNAAGPIVVDQDNSTDQIYDMDNGSKFFMSYDNATVYKKTDVPLQESIYDAERYAKMNVLNVFFVKPDYVLVCTSTETYVHSAHQIEVDGEVGQPLATLKYTLTKQCTGDTAYLDDVFAGKAIDNSTSIKCQILKFVAIVDEDGQVQIELQPMHTVDGDVDCIAYKNVFSTMYFASHYGSVSTLYRCKIVDGIVDSRSIQVLNSYSSEKSICCILFNDIVDEKNGIDQLTLFFSDGTVECTVAGSSLVNVSADISYAGISGVNGCCQIYSEDSAISDVIATTSGLRVRLNGLRDSTAYGENACVKSIVADPTGSTVWAGYDNGQLCSLNASNGSLLASASYYADSSIKSIAMCYSIPVIATSSGVYYLRGSKLCKIECTYDDAVCAALAKSNANQSIMHIVGNNSNGGFVVSLSTELSVSSLEIAGLKHSDLTCDSLIEYDDDSDMQYTSKTFSCRHVIDVAMLSDMQCAIVSGVLSIQFSDGQLIEQEYVNALNVSADIDGVHCSEVNGTDVLAESYNGLVRSSGNDAGIVYISSDGVDTANVLRHMQYSLNESENGDAEPFVDVHDYVFDINSFDSSLVSSYVVDGQCYDVDNNSLMAVVTLSSGASKALVCSQLVDTDDQRLVINYMSCCIGDVDTNIVQSGDVIYALSGGNDGHRAIIAISAVEDDSDDDSDDLENASLYSNDSNFSFQLTSLPSNLSQLGNSVSSLARDANGNMWLNTGYAFSDVSAWRRSDGQLCSMRALLPSFSEAVSGDFRFNADGSIVIYGSSASGQLSCLSCLASSTQLNVHSYDIAAQVSYVEAGHNYYPCIAANSELVTFDYAAVSGLSYAVLNEFFGINAEIANAVEVAGTDDILLATQPTGSYSSIWMYSYADNTAYPYGTYAGIQFAFTDNVYDSYHYVLGSSSTAVYAAQSLALYSALVQLSPYSSIGQYALKDNFKIGCISQDGAANGEYHAFMSYSDGGDYNTVEVIFSRLDRVTSVYAPSNARLQSAAKYALPTSNGKYIVAAPDDGLYIYQERSRLDIIDDHCYKVLDGSDASLIVQKFYDCGMAVYTATSADMLLSSSSGMWWEPYAKVSASIDDSRQLVSYLQTSPYTLFAGKDGGGMLFAVYRYIVSDSTQQFTAESAIATYELHKKDVSDCISSVLSTHIDYMHGDGSTIQLLNDYMPTSFPIPESFTRAIGHDGVSSVANDYIEHIFEGTNGNEVDAYVHSSTMSADVWCRVDGMKYIAKQWKSGVVELYVYLPTTQTYYIPHISGLPCNSSDGIVQVNGQNVEPSIQKNTTHIKLNVLSSFFEVKHVYENTVKGNSLPLKIYKETSLVPKEGLAAIMYHSYVEPSVARHFDNTKSIFDYYIAEYYCFGSDAQAIKLVIDSTSKNYLKKYKTIVYHSGDDSWRAYELNTPIVQQRFLDGDLPKTLYWDIFDSQSIGMFLGWSRDKGSTSPDAQYSKGKTMSYSQFGQLEVIDLYAVWIIYQFDSTDTTIQIDNKGTQTYTVSQIAIDPTITFDNPSKSPLGNRLVVKFEDE